MKQTVAFSSSIDIDLKDAITAAKDSFPNVDFSSVKTAIELETLINNIGQTLYVDVDTDQQVIAAQQEEAALKTTIDEEVNTLSCDLPPAVFTPEDLASTNLCETPDDYPSDVITPDEQKNIDKELADLQTSLDAEGTNVQGQIDDVLACVSTMTDITNALVVLNNKERDIKNTLINMEELLYNYRIMEAYHKKRLLTVNQLLGEFDPLITEERDYQAQIDAITPLDTKAKSDLDTAIANFNAQNGTTTGTSGVSGSTTQHAVSGTSGISGTTTTQGATNNTPPAPVETQAHINQLQATYNEVHTQLLDLQAKLKDVQDKIKFDENKISPFLSEINFEQTPAFLGLSPTEQETSRLQWLNDNIQGLFNGGSTAFSKAASFSTRTVITANSGSATLNQSFIFTIQHTFTDVQNILIGKPKTYMNSGGVTIEAFQNGVTPHGTLYDQLYNIWGDIELFFTREERGLTSDSNYAAPQLKGTGAEVFKSNFIQDQGKFTDFYENFSARHRDKVTFIKSTIIEPTLKDVVSGLEDLALKEVQYLFAYGKAFEELPAESSKLVDIITSIRTSSQSYLTKILELRNDYVFVQQAYKNAVDAIESKKQEYYQVKCAKQDSTPPEKDPAPAGSDPLGANTIQQVFPEDPDPTKWCYWLKFAAMATAVNILPLPGSGGFRYWPVGLIIPTPAGAVNIPLPIIWIPIAVIVLPVGVFVIFIGQCGVCPSPFVFFMGPNGEKKFIVSMRPTEDFGANASESIIKTVEKGGIAINTGINSMLNKINIPSFKGITNPDDSSTMLDDLKDKILKKVNKIGLPDMTPITNKISTNSTIAEKKAALKEVIDNHLNKLVVPTIKIPKDASKTNPKPLPITEVLNDLNKLLKMKLPQISIPTTETIDLTQKLKDQVGKLKISDLPSVNVPAIDYSTATPSQINDHTAKIKKALKDGINTAHLKITPKELGIVTTVLGQGIVFINPYKCKPGAKGLGVPPIPPVALAGLAALKVAAEAFIDGLSLAQIKQSLQSVGGSLTTGLLANMISDTLKSIPSVTIPNPSNISIKDMLKDSMKKLVKMQMPSLPDPTAPPQIQIPIPGDGIKGVLVGAVDQTFNNFNLTGIDVTSLSAIDVKQIIVSIVETSFAPVQNFLDPILKVISVYQSSKNKTFPELIGLKKVSTDHSKVAVVPKLAMDAAIAELKALALVPYPAVAILPEVFKELHPVLSSDDTPPWKRLTLDNFLFVIFLDQFCQEGKKGGGLLENP